MVFSRRVVGFSFVPLIIFLISCGGDNEGDAPSDPVIVSVYSSALKNIKLSWSASADAGTDASEMRYEIHASLNENFVPGKDSLLSVEQGKTSSEIDSSRLTPESTQYVRVVAKNKRGQSAASAVRSVKIEGMEINPNRAGKGVLTTFMLRGKDLGDVVYVNISGCNPIDGKSTKVVNSSTVEHQCTPAVGGNVFMNGRVSAAAGSRDFLVTATDQNPTGIKLKNIPFGQQKIRIARIPVTGQSAIIFPPAFIMQCSKIEMQRKTAVISIPESRCDSYKDSFGITWPYNCRTEMVDREVSTDVPVAYVGDQEFTADIDMNIPDGGVTFEQIKSDVRQVVSDSVKTALEQHVKGSVDQLANGIKNCAITAGAVAVTSSVAAAYASAGSGAAAVGTSASTIFWGVFGPCADTEVTKSVNKITNLSDAINSVSSETKKELSDYFNDKIISQKPSIKFDSQCANWHPL